MATQSTQYKVDIVYDLKGSASKGLRNMGEEAKGATASMGGLRNMLAVIGGGALFAAGRKALITFNSDIERMKIGLATVTAMNLHTPFANGQKAADRLFETFQKMAAQSPATTKDFVEMANLISSGVLQAGLGLKDLESITKGAITASAALGARPDMLALDVTQMLAGTVAIRDRYARQLLSGIGETDYLKFNKYDSSKRAGLVQKAFEQSSITDAADAFGNSFEGVTSTLKDNLEIALGKVGLPLMREMTGMVKGWNEWITSNPDKIASMMSTLSSGLKEAFSLVKDIAVSMFPLIKDVFGVIKDVMSFVAENKDLLVNVVKGLVVYKGLQFGGGLISRGGKGLMGLFRGATGGMDKLSGIDSAAGEASGGLLNLAGTLSSALPGIGKFVGLLAGAAALPWLLNPMQKYRDEDAKKRAAELKTAQDYQGAAGKIGTMRERLRNIGIDPDDKTQDVGGLKTEIDELKAGKAKFEAQVISEAIQKGMVREDLDAAGTRRLTLTGPGAGVTKEFADTVVAVFKEKAKEAFAEQAYGMPRTAGFSGVTGNMGFYEEYVGAVKSQTDPYDLRATPPKVNVNIAKIEVYSDDPDRFVAQAVQSFEEVTRNPTQAHEIMRGAF